MWEGDGRTKFLWLRQQKQQLNLTSLTVCQATNAATANLRNVVRAAHIIHTCVCVGSVYAHVYPQKCVCVYVYMHVCACNIYPVVPLNIYLLQHAIPYTLLPFCCHFPLHSFMAIDRGKSFMIILIQSKWVFLLGCILWIVTMKVFKYYYLTSQVNRK